MHTVHYERSFLQFYATEETEKKTANIFERMDQSVESQFVCNIDEDISSELVDGFCANNIGRLCISVTHSYKTFLPQS